MGELVTEKHVRYILGVGKKKDSYEAALMEHLRMNGAYWGVTTLDLLGKLGVVDEAALMEHLRVNGAYWGLTTLDLLGKLGVVDEAEVVSWIMECQHESGGFDGNVGHDPHILYTLSAVQVLVLLDKIHVLDIDKIDAEVIHEGPLVTSDQQLFLL